MKDKEPRGTFRSDLDVTTPGGVTNYEGWPVEGQAKISQSRGLDPVDWNRRFMHGVILSLAVVTALIRACER